MPPSDFDWTQPGGRYVFFGFETDTMLATYLFTVIDRAIMTEAATLKEANPTLRAVRLRRASANSSMVWRHGYRPGWTPCTMTGKHRSGPNGRRAPR
jgi:hypothetical protein